MWISNARNYVNTQDENYCNNEQGNGKNRAFIIYNDIIHYKCWLSSSFIKGTVGTVSI